MVRRIRPNAAHVKASSRGPWFRVVAARGWEGDSCAPPGRAGRRRGVEGQRGGLYLSARGARSARCRAATRGSGRGRRPPAERARRSRAAEEPVVRRTVSERARGEGGCGGRGARGTHAARGRSARPTAPRGPGAGSGFVSNPDRILTRHPPGFAVIVSVVRVVRVEEREGRRGSSALAPSSPAANPNQPRQP